MTRQIELEENLNSFDPAARGKALAKLAEKFIVQAQPAHTNINMHFHSFFSYNAEAWSPSRIAWEARKAGLHAAALCDFDVLDGLEEFLAAGQTVGLRTAVHLETRAYYKECASVDISSPGEPGVTYIMGGGFFQTPADGSEAAKGLKAYRDSAQARNVALIGRINAQLKDIALDYQKDVVPLTPAGVPTERHIMTAYISKSKAVFEHPQACADYWSKIMKKTPEDVLLLMADTPAFEEIVRSKLAKRGGVGYEQPSQGTFPPVEEFIKWVLSCEAIPMITWLDGTSGGEQDPRKLLETLVAKGGASLNIIPDRNWNISNPQARATKAANLNAIVEVADELNLPINIGTEMNKLGLPFVDDLDGLVLKAYKKTFVKGARIMVGHTLLARYAGYPYVGKRADAEFKGRAAKNAFFEAVGGIPPVTARVARDLVEMGPEKALEWFRKTAAK